MRVWRSSLLVVIVVLLGACMSTNRQPPKIPRPSDAHLRDAKRYTATLGTAHAEVYVSDSHGQVCVSTDTPWRGHIYLARSPAAPYAEAVASLRSGVITNISGAVGPATICSMPVRASVLHAIEEHPGSFYLVHQRGSGPAAGRLAPQD